MPEIRAQEGPQTAWLSSEADIAVYGGAAFGGKTYALLLEPLRHIHRPGFGAVIFRRSCPQITNEGGLWDTSGEIYTHVRGRAITGSLDWRFPSGANINFSHLQHESTKYDWQGSQIPFIGFDELTHFSESQFFYLFSRNRDGSGCGVRAYIRATTNPDAGSWVKSFLGPWVDRRHAMYPTPSGGILWMLRVDGKIQWARTREELVDRYGPESDPKSVTFVKASIRDNRLGMARDPGYIGNLQAQTPVERARLLDGDWDVVNEGLVYPEFGQAVVEPEDWPAYIEGRRVGGIDWGWNNPFGALEATLDHDDVLWVHWERWGSRITLSQHSVALRRDYGHDVRWYADPAGADQTGELRSAGHDVVPCVHLGQRPLESGIALVAQRIRTGRLKIKGTLGHTIDEAGKYRYDGDKHLEKPIDEDNHLLAALRYMVVGIDRRRSVDPVYERYRPAADPAEVMAEAAPRETPAAVWTEQNQGFWEDFST